MVAVASTIVSPKRATQAPSAWRGMRPVSRVRVPSPREISRLRIMSFLSFLFFFDDDGRTAHAAGALDRSGWWKRIQGMRPPGQPAWPAIPRPDRRGGYLGRKSVV